MRRSKLRDGTELLLRPIVPSDKALLREGFNRLSPESRYRRFHSSEVELSGTLLRYLTEVDHHDHEALVAVDPGDGLGVGVGRFVRDRARPDRAEAAIAVVDDWQRRGVGTLLLEALTDRAREEGIERFVLLVQADNLKALELFRRLGAHDVGRHDTEVELELEIPAERGVGVQLPGALRAAAEGVLRVRSLVDWLRERAAGESVDYEPGDAIVVGTDGSPTARRAVAEAAGLARALGAPLHVVSAHRSVPDLLEPILPDALGRLRGSGERVERLLRDAADELAAAGVEAATHVVDGDPADALIQVATEQRAQLIVVGNKGMSGGPRYLLGSVPNTISHHAPCNVLIVRTDG